MGLYHCNVDSELKERLDGSREKIRIRNVILG